MYANTREALDMIRNGLAKLEALDVSGLPSHAVDIGAHVNAIRARAEALADKYKAHLWDITPAGLRDHGNRIPGDTFLAVLNVVPASRVDLDALRASHPRIVKRFTIEAPQRRVTFKALG